MRPEKNHGWDEKAQGRSSQRRRRRGLAFQGTGPQSGAKTRSCAETEGPRPCRRFVRPERGRGQNAKFEAENDSSGWRFETVIGRARRDRHANKRRRHTCGYVETAIRACYGLTVRVSR